ncbi:ATPase, T2SS/T4P/T4SS family [Achromobacter insuavis]|uniref:ATPase, T2SS/T4P/T4SS family n=1 Tax=Achromobacter insuavis TaxID=1287735 RepID=UPI001F146D85|nr:ATPase, T2SS/T4P/T4SS family [Achromobacter insuavis]
MLLDGLKFVDMYLGRRFCDLRGVEGTDGALMSLPDPNQADLERLRETCAARREQTGLSEFSLKFDDEQFRVTAIRDVDDQIVWMLSRSGFDVMPLKELRLPPKVMDAVLNSKLGGLFIICGPMRAGKTTTAASIFRERLVRFGGLGLTVEDPPEAALHGIHGEKGGRCIQIPVSRQFGASHEQSFQEQMMRVLRSRADQFLIGEIRNGAMALEMMQVASAIGPIFATTHGESPEQCLLNLQARCRGEASTHAFNSMLAEALSGVLMQRLLPVPATDGSGYLYRLHCEYLLLGGPDDTTIRAKLGNGDFASLRQEMSQQKQNAAWSIK